MADSDKNGKNTAEHLKKVILASNAKIETDIETRICNQIETKIGNSAKKQEESPREITRLVALVAHNNMKPAMLSFVAQHRDFFRSVQV